MFFGVVPYANKFNPAIKPDSTIIIISPNIYADMGTNSFGLKNVFSPNEKKGNKKYYDLNYIIENSGDKNFLYGTADYSGLFIGKILANGYYATFSMNERNNYNFLLPRDLFELNRGNTDYETETVRNFNLDGLSVNGISYTSYSFGLSKKIGPAFNLGLHLKLLDGKYVTETRNFNASISTKDDFAELYFEGDIRNRQSAPGLVSDNPDDVNFSAENIRHPFFLHNNFFKNLGFAFDFGFHYTPDGKTSIQGSVTDIGFINWNSEQRELHYKGSYNFTGFDFSPNSEGYFDMEGSISNVVDSIKEEIEPVLNSTDPFRTRITPRVLLGFSRTVSRRIELLSLFRAGIYSSYMDYSYTLGAIYKLSPAFNFCFSTSRKNNRIGNFGAGMYCRLKWFEFFLSSENVEYLITNSSSINLSLGLNFILLNKGYSGQ